MDSLLRDIRVGARELRRAPGFAVTAILTLAMGIGLATAVFTVAEAFLLRPLPVRDQGDVVVLWDATLGLVALLLLGVATLGSLIPAWSGSRIDPIVALGTE